MLSFACSILVSRFYACVLLSPAGSGYSSCCRFRGCSSRARPRISWPDLGLFSRRPRIGWSWLQRLPALLRGLAIGALAVALARPQTVGGTTYIAGQGVAIVVVLDNSSSMNTVDFPTDMGTRLISRLQAAKNTFIASSKADPTT